MIDFKSTPSYQFGHVAEVQIEELLKSYGAYIIPSYDYSGGENKAPRLGGIDHSFVIPDLDVMIHKRIWVEVKRKTQPDLHRITGDYVHGIPLRHYNDYIFVEKISGCKVWIVFVDQKVSCGKLSELKIHHKYTGDKMSHGGMVFFNITDLHPINYIIQELIT